MPCLRGPELPVDEIRGDEVLIVRVVRHGACTNYKLCARSLVDLREQVSAPVPMLL